MTTDPKSLAAAYATPSSQGPNPTDLGNAQRLVAKFGDLFRYCAPQRRYYIYDDRRWVPDETGEVMRFAKDTVHQMVEEAASLVDAERRALIAHALKSEAEPRLRAMLTLAASEPGVPVLPRDLDADPWQLNLENGVLDLKSGEMADHDPDLLLTHLAPVSFDPEADCPTWLAFLDRVLDSDKELIAFVQRAVGYSLTGDTREQVLFFLHGSGANGKSTFLDVLRNLLGSYAVEAGFETFVERPRGGANSDVARLAGRRFVAAVEAGEGHRFAEALVKQVTGGDAIVARHLYAEFFEFRPQFKLWLAANHKPVVRGTDLAIWRRIRLLPFTVTIPEGERDGTLPERLRAELPGILRWAVEGCLLWQQGGLGNPAAVRAATEEYRSEMDVLAPFFEARCTVAPNAIAGATQLYRAYGRWAEQAGERTMTQTLFGRQLAERGFTREKVSRGLMAWRGLSLRDADDADGSDSSGGFSDSFPMRAREEEV